MENQIENSKQIEVKGFRYIVSHPGPETAWDIGVELTKLIGESLSSMAMAGDGDKAAAALSAAVKTLLGKVDAKASWRLVVRILGSVECQGPVDGQTKKFMLNENSIKLHFQGKTGAMIRLVGEVVSFTHEDFFEAIGDGIASMMDRTGKAQ